MALPFPAAAFLWPVLAARRANEFAVALTRDMVALSSGADEVPAAPEPEWTTRNSVVLELASVRLRDFSLSGEGPATLVCAPFALHRATLVDLAPRHSLVAALQGAGLQRLFVAEWRSAPPGMSSLAIDDFLAALNVLVDELGGRVDLVGLCQGGWMALAYAARFPDKVRRLALAGAPVDIGAGESRLSRMACDTPIELFEQLVEAGGGRVLGSRLRRLWDQGVPEPARVHRDLQAAEAVESPQFRALEARFRAWEASTVDLPGAYYLQVVGQLFKENRLAAGRFVALGRRLDLSRLSCPMFLLAGSDDEVAAPAQLFALERLVAHDCPVRKLLAPSTHLGLFMGRATLAEAWPEIARWLAPRTRSSHTLVLQGRLRTSGSKGAPES
jgi:poly(3-hydroxyalkanoate) synthetase